MPQPVSLFGVEQKTSTQPTGLAYVCVNFRCRFRAFERLHNCPACGRVGNFMLESDVQTRNLIAGIIFIVIGVLLITLAVLLLVVSATGFFGPQTEERPIWKPVLVIFGIGAILLCGGISTAKGHYWLVKLLKGLG